MWFKSTAGIEVETSTILVEGGVDTSDFPPESLESLPTVPDGTAWEIPAEELKKRRDFRSTMIFSIDPPTARDLDDALSWTMLPDGNVEVGVHIADVSYFMQPGTALDAIAARRATTTYLVQRCYPMLPRLLCENLCSLVSNEDRLAFSIVWKMKPCGGIVSTWIGRTVIRSCAKLSYSDAQAIIDDPDVDWEANGHPAISGGHTVAGVKTTVLGLHALATRLRAGRESGGSVRRRVTCV